MASNGFIELLRLSDRAIKRQKGQHISGKMQWLGVAFIVNGQQLVAPLGDIAEVLAVPEITPVPLAKPWLMGIANVRGRLLPITDLGRFIGVSQAKTHSLEHKLLVIDQPKVFSGLLVDEVLGIQTFNERHYEAVAMPEDSPFSAYTHGRFRHNNQEWYIFMPSLLAEDPHYLEAAL
ncbi:MULTISPECIES: chemotaxis protein CheW [unclassified Moraxella]|uniref:chemotaxis protein CheW n=1 Tax=unclassified Moraxella TaxID=2685852 RepID=UPI003AF61E07